MLPLEHSELVSTGLVEVAFPETIPILGLCVACLDMLVILLIVFLRDIMLDTRDKPASDCLSGDRSLQVLVLLRPLIVQICRLFIFLAQVFFHGVESIL